MPPPPLIKSPLGSGKSGLSRGVASFEEYNYEKQLYTICSLKMWPYTIYIYSN